MAKNFVAVGRSVQMAAPSGGVVSGNGYLIGSMFGVAGADAAEGVTFTLHVTGIWSLKKEAGTAWNEGDAIYWDSQLLQACTRSGSDHTKIGVACNGGALSAAVVGTVRLNASF